MERKITLSLSLSLSLFLYLNVIEEEHAKHTMMLQTMVQTDPNAELMRKPELPEWENVPYYYYLIILSIVLLS